MSQLEWKKNIIRTIFFYSSSLMDFYYLVFKLEILVVSDAFFH